MTEAPFFSDLAQGPEGGYATWVKAKDGVRLRLGLWPADAARGTMFLFPGRTEYIEKYGMTAKALTQAGLSVFAIDWRGQGLSDRLTSDPMAGHVHHFSDYQLDVAAMVDKAKALDLPKPWYLLAHSMGGCIGLRATMEGLSVDAVAFSAPMWGIKISAPMRPVAWSLSWSSRSMGLDHNYAPGTIAESYVLNEPFETNKLTTDSGMYKYMINQLEAQPDLGLGGPSLRWLYESLNETRRLASKPSPDLPCLVLLGSDEDIVEPSRIHDRVARWPGAVLDLVEGGRHEVLMEVPQMRDHAIACLIEFFKFSNEVTASETPVGFVCQGVQCAKPSRRRTQGNA